MKTLTLLALLIGTPVLAQDHPTDIIPKVILNPSKNCPQLGGVYYKAGVEPRQYALFVQTGCQKLEIKLLTDKGPEIYFSVPVIGEVMSVDADGATFQAYWKGGQLYSETTSKQQIAIYKINLRPFDGGVVQVSDYELRTDKPENEVHHEVITWEAVL